MRLLLLLEVLVGLLLRRLLRHRGRVRLLLLLLGRNGSGRDLRFGLLRGSHLHAGRWSALDLNRFFFDFRNWLLLLLLLLLVLGFTSHNSNFKYNYFDRAISC